MERQHDATRTGDEFTFSILISDRSGGTQLAGRRSDVAKQPFSILISDRSGGTRRALRPAMTVSALSVSSYRIAPVEHIKLKVDPDEITSFSILISDRSGGTRAGLLYDAVPGDFQYPHIGSLRWNTTRWMKRTRCISSFSILISDRSGGTVTQEAWDDRGFNFQYPHIGSLRWNRRFGGVPAGDGLCFQYPHIGSLRWNTATAPETRAVGRAFSILISDRSGGTHSSMMSIQQRNGLSVSSYRIAPVELGRGGPPVGARDLFQYPHIGSLRWNPGDQHSRPSALVAFSILISDRSGGTASINLVVQAETNLSVSSYRIAPVERRIPLELPAGATFFQYPHIGSLRWNLSASQ